MRSLSLLEHSGAPPDRPAVLVGGRYAVGYGELDALTVEVGRELGTGAKAVVLCRMSRDIPSIVGYLAALRAGHCVLPVEFATPAVLDDLVGTYRPEIVLDAGTDGWTPSGYRGRPLSVGAGSLNMAFRAEGTAGTVHPETGLLLRTSGSLGRSKAVRLTYANVAANALSIATALALGATDRAPITLPLEYSFGLSVLHSHLAAGASVVLGPHSPTSAKFRRWSAATGCTALYAVPTTYRLLLAGHWRAVDHGHLRALYQAGGALPTEDIRYFAEQMAAVGGTFTVMYGQTEATARMTVLDPARTLDRCGSVGSAIPGGRLWIADEDEPGRRLPDGEVGEVYYSGPNVMQGYATGRADLAAGDECGGVLATGDLGRVRDGLLYLAGRRDRVVKLLGRRINLAEVEAAFAGVATEVAVVATPPGGRPARMVVCLSGAVPAPESLARRRGEIAVELGLPVPMIDMVPMPRLPRTVSGKVDYPALLRSVRMDGS